MAQIDNILRQTDRSLLAKLLILFGLSMVLLAIGSFIGFGIFSFMTNIELGHFMDFQQNPTKYPQAWYAVMLLQVLSTPLPFVSVAVLYTRLIESFTPLQAVAQPKNLLIWIVLLVISFMPFDSIIIEWNKQIHLPASFHNLEVSMQQSEKTAQIFTDYITNFTSPLQLLIAIVVIAGAAALSEELLFRGVLQNIFYKSWQNPHVAIWVAAFWFSFIHFQFYGFFPRMLLGAMFGYLYHWTGRIELAVLAHFVNNGFTVVMKYCYNIGVLKADIVDTESVPLPMVLVSFVVCVFVLFKIKKTADEGLAKNL